MSGVNFIARLEWRIYKSLKRKRLRNTSLTLIADNCNAGIILHDLGLKFNTPTVNLWFHPDDYLRFLKRLSYYLSLTPIQIQDDSVTYPVGMLDDVKVYFMHYATFELARDKWCERSKRVNFDNLYLLMTDKNGCTFEQMKEFDALSHQHKVLFLHKPHPEIACGRVMPGFEDKNEVGVLSDFKPGFFRRRYLDDFDYVKFLNQK